MRKSRCGTHRTFPRKDGVAVKLVFEILISAILHPIAVILMWINLSGRTDMSDGKKIVWAIVGLVWGVGPILYMLVGDGDLW